VKSGTNSFHGDLYDYWGNAILNANQWVSNETGTPRSSDTRNTYGGTLGGPVFKNKTFFFGSFEGFQQAQPGVVQDSVPTAAMRTGNFAGSGYTIYDPSTVTCTRPALQDAVLWPNPIPQQRDSREPDQSHRPGDSQRVSRGQRAGHTQ